MLGEEIAFSANYGRPTMELERNVCHPHDPYWNGLKYTVKYSKEDAKEMFAGSTCMEMSSFHARNKGTASLEF